MTELTPFTRRLMIVILGATMTLMICGWAWGDIDPKDAQSIVILIVGGILALLKGE